jgi:hypothetical protein
LPLSRFDGLARDVKTLDRIHRVKSVRILSAQCRGRGTILRILCAILFALL